MKKPRTPPKPLTLLLISLLFLHPSLAGIPIKPPPATAQITNIVEALVGAGDFGSWANLLFGTDPSTLPISATLFVPTDEAIAHLFFNNDFTPSILQYHTVPRRYTYQDLQKLEPGTRIPTLLSNNTILITNNSRSNFTLDGSLITHPDIYKNAGIAVHGVNSPLNLTRYGSPVQSSPELDQTAPTPTPSLRFEPSAVSCHCIEFPVILSAVSAVIAVKLLRYT